VFENRVLRGIFGPKRDEITKKWRKLHNGELHNLYSSPDIIKQIKSRRMMLVVHVAHMGEGRNVCRFWSESPKENYLLEDQSVDGRMGLECILGRLAGGGGVEWIHLAEDRDWWWAVVNTVMNLWVIVLWS
jgi:hypothetical protein